ncbi:MAG: pitH [Verrucomicrobiales bacterium]|nr:pitH [Verrucomicrobiales bacterium]
MALILTVIFVALIFEYINGFHDTANSIATVVSTKVLTPRQAIMLAVGTNLLGAMYGTAVANTIASGLLDTKVFQVSNMVIICALLGAIIWNLVTWYVGLPSSSSHALIGGLCGAALAAANNSWSVILWSQPDPDHWYKSKGILWKVILPMVTSPIAGLILGFCLMAILYICLQNARPHSVNGLFKRLQVLSAGGMGFMHGSNDAQKTMGIITLGLVAATKGGFFDAVPGWLSWLHTPEGTPGDYKTPIAWIVTHLPSWLQFGYQPEVNDLKKQFIPMWVIVTCALTMAAGTAAGGWRIIRTLGHKMVKLHPINGFAAETSSAAVIFAATHFGIPVSTTHNISASIMGVGAAKRFSAVKWSVVEKMVWAWILTIPVSALLGYMLVRISQLF